MQLETAVDLYEPPDMKVQIAVRVPGSVRAGVDDVVRLWKLFAESRGDNAKDIDLTFVVTRLLKVGIDQAFAEFGERPKDEAGWKVVEKTIRAAAKPQK